MDLKDLKSAWDKYSSQEMDKHRLGKENIHELLKNRTQTLVERIDRNIRIGMSVLLLFIVYVIIDSFFLTKLPEAIVHQTVEYPKWLIPIDFFSTTLIVTTYLFFAIRYFRIKQSFSIDHQIKELLQGIKETLITYRRMFYLVVIILLINIALSFTAGAYEGLKLLTNSMNTGIESLTITTILKITGIGLAALIPIVTITFFLLRWGFNKLYGRYLVKLDETLQELDESTNGE